MRLEFVYVCADDECPSCHNDPLGMAAVVHDEEHDVQTQVCVQCASADVHIMLLHVQYELKKFDGVYENWNPRPPLRKIFVENRTIRAEEATDAGWTADVSHRVHTALKAGVRPCPACGRWCGATTTRNHVNHRYWWCNAGHDIAYINK